MLIRNFCAKFCQTVKELLQSEDFRDRHKAKDSYFTRNTGPLDFYSLMAFLLKPRTSSLSKELRVYFEDLDADDPSKHASTSKSALCQARNKIKMSAFQELLDHSVNFSYGNHGIARWNDYRVIATDGSTLVLPRSDGITEYFGGWDARNGDEICPMGRFHLMYDVLNDICVHAGLTETGYGEREYLQDCLGRFSNSDLMLLDRGYASFLLFSMMFHKGMGFCARIPECQWKVAEEMIVSGDQDRILEIECPVSQLKGCRDLGLPTKLKLRAIKIELSTGESEVLLTNLLDPKITAKDFDGLYQMRWGVEEKFKVFKCRIENQKFTGKSVLSVYQDFLSSVIFANITSMFVRSASQQIETKKWKHTHKINMTEALAILKGKIRKLMKSQNFGSIIGYLIDEISRFTEPVRKGRKYPHDKSNKILHANFCYPRLS